MISLASVGYRAAALSPTVGLRSMSSRISTILVLLVGLAGCGESELCGNDVKQSIPSPSGKVKAVVFNRDCGATTGFSTQVSVVPADEVLPNGGGNALVLDGTVPLQVHWQTETTLSVSGIGDAKVFQKVGVVSGIQLVYAN